MKTIYAFLPAPLLLAAVTTFAMDDHTLLTGINLHQLEQRHTDDGNALAWHGDIWLGQDLHKLILKSEGEYHDSQTEKSQLQLLYSQAVAAYWDFQAGWRGDLEPGPERHWLALGVQGLAPYYVDVDATLFIGNQDRTALRLGLEYELMLTQKIALVPTIEFNFYGQNDPDAETGAGLSDIETGLRLQYEIRREFAPYVGVHYEKKYGNSARFARAHDEAGNETAWVAGIHAWF